MILNFRINKTSGRGAMAAITIISAIHRAHGGYSERLSFALEGNEDFFLNKGKTDRASKREKTATEKSEIETANRIKR